MEVFLKNTVSTCPDFILLQKDTGLDGLLVKISTAVSKSSAVTRKLEKRACQKRKIKIITVIDKEGKKANYVKAEVQMFLQSPEENVKYDKQK